MNGNRQDVDVVFVYPRNLSVKMAFDYSLGAGYVGAYLNQRGFKTLQFVTERPISAPDFVRSILDLNPRIVGFTVYYNTCSASALLAAALKTANPQCLVVFGGPLPSVVPEKILAHHDCVDICVRGEGEEVLEALLGAVADDSGPPDAGKLCSIKGLHFRTKEGILETPDSDRITSSQPSTCFLDRYPSPYLSGFIPVHVAPHVGIITARGCNQNCVYCNCAVMWKRKIFPHSVDRVLEELAYIADKSSGLLSVVINDDAFNLLPGRAEKICLGILEQKIDLQLNCFARCDMVSEDLLRLMKEAGFNSISFSLESAVPHVLRAIGKVSPPETDRDPDFTKEKNYLEKLVHYTQLAKQLGFQFVGASYMIGLPGESLEEAAQTVRFAEDLKVELQDNLFTIFPGTPIHQTYKKYGYRLDYLAPSVAIPNPIHPHPVRTQVTVPEASMNRREARTFAEETARMLSLVCENDDPQTAFSQVIFLGNRPTDRFVDWLNRNLAIGGICIQIYPDKLSVPPLQGYRDIKRTLILKDFHGRLRSLYVEKQKDPGEGMFRFIPWENAVQREFSIVRSQFEPAFAEGFPLRNPMRSAICAETSSRDITALHTFLEQVETSPDPFAFLWRLPRMPFFEGLCKWLSRNANCRTFETAIVDDNGDVRICRHAAPSGTLKDDHHSIAERFQDYAQEALRHRACKTCEVAPTCIRCPFPHPITHDAYCGYRRKRGVHCAAEFLHRAQLSR